MRVFHKLEDVPADFGPTFATVGNFDGVHQAHAHVLRDIVARAKAHGAQAVAVTFEPHPTRILKPEAGLKLLTPTHEKLRWLQLCVHPRYRSGLLIQWEFRAKGRASYRTEFLFLPVVLP